ncbi:hypothetical protein BpHYR1_008731 [Brachionus plicatilis]|uniref:Uncharacterized protein n=1 Tax=Brachionus plicatilis TaxID=10195 RepID=A0A3M7SQR6_BRAPC|nr:hypothetical protein BpHYR1_008731 [Brachionus plicatilis]
MIIWSVLVEWGWKERELCLKQKERETERERERKALLVCEEKLEKLLLRSQCFRLFGLSVFNRFIMLVALNLMNDFF